MQVKTLTIYPVKSMSGINLDEAKLDRRGFRYDRQWMLIDEKGKFLSQREIPAMALIKTRISKKELQLEYEGKSLSVDINAEMKNRVSVSVWNSKFKCYHIDEKYDRWFSTFLEKDCRLVVLDKKDQRNKRLSQAPWQTPVSFADGYPYLILGTASLELLNNKLDEPIPANRFRPNIIIETRTPHEEDTWSEIMIGDQKMSIVKPCARCVMTTIDQENATKSTEPLHTLASYRKEKNKILFGVNAVGLTTGSIHTGDEVKIL